MGGLNVMTSYKTYFGLTTATKALNTCMVYFGALFSTLVSATLIDRRGRKEAMYWSATLTMVGAIIQGAALNVGTFLLGRFVIGLGLTLAQTAGPTLLAETTTVQYRGFTLAMYYAFWNVGTLISGGAEKLDSSWAWRIPSLIQALPSILCFLILLFIPESPRWLISKGRSDEALQILVVINAADSTTDSIVQHQFREMKDAISWGKDQQLTLVQTLSQRGNRRRIFIVVVFGAIVMLSGTGIVDHYFGDMLSAAGITNPTSQLQINMLITVWGLLVGFSSSYFADSFGRKLRCALGLTGGVIALFLFGGFIAAYGHTANKGGLYAAVAMMFLYKGTYGWGITPIIALYPPEVLSYNIRAVGMSIYTLSIKLSGLVVNFVLPFGMDAIGWRLYIINGFVDILMVLCVCYYFVETRGLTLEEVDQVLDRVKHSDIPDLVPLIQEDDNSYLESRAID
ncbi:general substrate transporter [Xylariales sp. PMI_506]|nr:general substrate transporter [Xylariales sp. PMI_506]